MVLHITKSSLSKARVLLLNLKSWYLKEEMLIDRKEKCDYENKPQRVLETLILHAIKGGAVQAGKQ